jgi:hypothetical protein
MRDLIKIHKDNVTIRPTVNWKESPAYKLLKFMVKTLQSYITLPYAFNPTNTHTLTKDLKEIKCGNNTKLASFDISNMYTNVPIVDVLKIIDTELSHNRTNTSVKKNKSFITSISFSIKITSNIMTHIILKLTA